jgi:hypothetical protein
MDAINIASVSKNQAQAAGVRVEINVLALVFELAKTEVLAVGSL